MAFSRIEINFTEDLKIRDKITLRYVLNNNTYSFVWHVKNQRNNSFDIEEPIANSNTGYASALSFYNAFNIDVPNGYEVTINQNTVTLSSLNESLKWVDVNNEKTDTDIVNFIDNEEGYVENYFLEYCDDFNAKKRVSIKKLNYTGAVHELTGSENPFFITYESSEDFKFTPLRPSTAEVNVIFDDEKDLGLNSFWDANEKTYKVELWNEDKLKWVGFVPVSGFEYEYRGGKYNATLTAVDGLTSLESIRFVDDNDRPYGNSDLIYNTGFQFPPSLILTEILKKTGLNLDLWSCIDTYERTMNPSADDRFSDPLSSCLFNVKTFIKENDNTDVPYWYGSGEEWNCKEVLENICRVFGARIFQSEGVWKIKSITSDIEKNTSKSLVLKNVSWRSDTLNVEYESIGFSDNDLTLQYKNRLSDDWVDFELSGESPISVLRANPNMTFYIFRIVKEGVVSNQQVYVRRFRLFYFSWVRLTSGNNQILDNEKTWKKYNTANVFIGKEKIPDDRVVPCNSREVFLLGNDHVIAQDEVYKAFRINYEYTFLREGDDPLSLIENGSFCAFYDTSIISAPQGWFRWRRDNKWYIRARKVTITQSDFKGEGNCALEIGRQRDGVPTRQGNVRTDPNPAIWASMCSNTVRYTRGNFTLNESDKGYVEKNSKIKMSYWFRYKERADSSYYITYRPILRAIFYGRDNVYYLRNSDEQKLTWHKIDNFNTDTSNAYFFYPSNFVKTSDYSRLEYNWYKYVENVQDAPEDGILQIHIHGLGASSGRDSDSFPAFRVWVRDYNDTARTLKKKFKVVRKDWVDQGGDIPRLQVANFKVGFLPNANDLPESRDYLTFNENPEHSLQVEPITIFNGDLQDENHISNIIVPTNTEGKNFWQDIDKKMRPSSLGLLVANQIMRQYSVPNKILEGDVRIDSSNIDDVFSFETLTGDRFIMQRGSFNDKRQIIEEGTFVQISRGENGSTGIVSGENLDPEWERTGEYFCEKNTDSLNTGRIVYQEIDVNPNSETYQQHRDMITDDVDYDTCPLNVPIEYFWGVSSEIFNYLDFKISPYDRIAVNEIEIEFNNDGYKYLYFLHLKTLGVVEEITTDTSKNNVISEFQYMNDIVINGYIYRVLRSDYKMTAFNNFKHNIKFS